MLSLFVLLLAGFQIKHFFADYMLQQGSMLTGKGDLRSPGGYLHAGVHAVFSLVVLLFAAVPFMTIVWLVLAEFVVHYALDFGKVRLTSHVQSNQNPRLFWALHGLDQLFHQFTYVAMIWVGLMALGY